MPSDEKIVIWADNQDGMKDYYEAVYDVVCMIPPGRVTTYGIIADYLTLGSARMVGYALRQHHAGYGFIPAHRVVNSSGILTGKNHFPYPDYMAEELRREGVEVVDDKVVDFKEKLWWPEESLGLSYSQ